MKRRHNAVVVLTLLSFAAAGWGAADATSSRRLPDVITQDICKRYAGKPAFDSDDKTTTIDCDWIREMAAITRMTPVEEFRKILDHAHSLTDLRTAKWPAGVDCGDFTVQPVADNLTVVCKGDLGEMVPYVFFADAQGTIRRMETVLDYKRVFREALRRSVVRGKISRFYDPYIDLNTDLAVAKMKFTALPLDSVRLENGRISIVMQAAPAKAP